MPGFGSNLWPGPIRRGVTRLRAARLWASRNGARDARHITTHAHYETATHHAHTLHTRRIKIRPHTRNRRRSANAATSRDAAMPRCSQQSLSERQETAEPERHCDDIRHPASANLNCLSCCSRFKHSNTSHSARRPTANGRTTHNAHDRAHAPAPGPRPDDGAAAPTHPHIHRGLTTSACIRLDIYLLYPYPNNWIKWVKPESTKQ
jgi:hypothetical protein